MSDSQGVIVRQQFLVELDEVLGLRPGTLRGDERLDELPNWDSTALIVLIAMAESTNNIRISPEQVVGCSTVADLLRLAMLDGRDS
jgi:acyl carrier protein